ncbi:MFS transporter [Curvivirga sp.]|uniref:MFS transporter n=1 Tax=Curvivirga sp. TaxID=2856848 RepID=UPI003B58EBF3
MLNFLSRPAYLFAIAQTFLWAGSIYLFPALLLEWERKFDWARTDVVAGLTLALVASAVLAPIAGKIIDKGHGRKLLISSAMTMGCLVAGLSLIQDIYQFYLVWFLIGITMAGCLYEACFAFLNAFLGAESKKTITVITLISGLAGTIAFSTISALVSIGGWQFACYCFATLILLISVPCLWLATSSIMRDYRIHAHHGEDISDPPKVKQILANPLFWVIALTFAIVALNHGMIVNHLLPILDERNINHDTAVLTISMLGPLQVAGRIAMMAADKKLSALQITIFAFFGIFMASFILLGAESVPSMLVFFVVLQGGCYGVMSIVRPMVIGDILGRKNFGAISGLAAMPYLTTVAFSPFFGAWIWRVSSYNVMLTFTGIMALVGFLSFLWLRKQQVKSS